MRRQASSSFSLYRTVCAKNGYTQLMRFNSIGETVAATTTSPCISSVSLSSRCLINNSHNTHTLECRPYGRIRLYEYALCRQAYFKKAKSKKKKKKEPCESVFIVADKFLVITYVVCVSYRVVCVCV